MTPEESFRKHVTYLSTSEDKAVAFRMEKFTEAGFDKEIAVFLIKDEGLASVLLNLLDYLATDHGGRRRPKI